MSWGESDHLLFIRAFASETKLNDIQRFDIITISPWLCLHLPVSLIASMLIQFLCIVWKLSFKAKQDDSSGFPFLLLLHLLVKCERHEKAKTKPSEPLFFNWFHVNAPSLLFSHSKALSPMLGCERRNCLWFSTDFPVLCFLRFFPVEISSHAPAVNTSRASHYNYEGAERCLGRFCVGVGYVAPATRWKQWHRRNRC